jgi:hypothetical protein
VAPHFFLPGVPIFCVFALKRKVPPAYSRADERARSLYGRRDDEREEFYSVQISVISVIRGKIFGFFGATLTG